MQPYLNAAQRTRAEIVSLKEKLKALKKADEQPDVLETIETRIQEQEKASRQSQSKADSIGTSVFDLKAVNPNVVVKNDSRTPPEVIQSIEDQGKIALASLKVLRALLTSQNPVA
jgi:type I restriction enzyme M protein